MNRWVSSMRRWAIGTLFRILCSILFCSILFCSTLLLSGCQTPPANQASSANPDVIHLTLWHGINPPSNRDVFVKLVDEFNRTHTNVQVEQLYVGQADQQLPKILTAVVGNASPDMLWFDSLLTGQLVELEAIQPIEDWLNQSPLKADIDPALFEGMELEGHLWSVPFTTSNLGIFYRPSLFQAAGITGLPETWEQFREVAQQLTRDTNGDGRPDQFGMVLPLGKGEWTVFSWLPFLFSAGGEMIQNNQPTLVNPGAIAALDFWSNLLQDGSAVLSQPERGYEQDDFIRGRVAMQITGPWTLGFLEETGIDFDVMPIPKAQTASTIVGGANLFVMKTTPEREQAALEFLEYVLSEPFQVKWASDTGALPISLQARENPDYQAYIATQPVLNVFLEQMPSARSRPNIPGYARLSENLGKAIEETLLTHSPETALQKAQRRLDLIW
jgi:multiple sugar transport system substrate-binding protein